METIALSIVNETEALKQLRQHLDAKIFSKQKADVCLIFDTQPSTSFFKEVLGAFFDYKSAFLKMIKYEIKPTIGVKKLSVHNGENIAFTRHSIIIGDIHEGAVATVHGNLVVIGEVCGQIRLISDDCSIFATKFTNAKIITSFNEVHRINGKNTLINNKSVGGKIWQE